MEGSRAGPNGQPVWTDEMVSKALSKYGGFELVEEKEMPFLIREHRRKYQVPPLAGTPPPFTSDPPPFHPPHFPRPN